MNKEALQEVLRKHETWLRGETGGERADLAGANLREADLTGADLTGANLAGAYLTGAYLGGTCIVRFQAGRHEAYWHRTQPGMESEGGMLKIGCEQHSLLHWSREWEGIGTRHSYGDKAFLYGMFIYACYEAWKREGGVK